MSLHEVGRIVARNIPEPSTLAQARTRAELRTWLERRPARERRARMMWGAAGAVAVVGLLWFGIGGGPVPDSLDAGQLGPVARAKAPAPALHEPASFAEAATAPEPPAPRLAARALGDVRGTIDPIAHRVLPHSGDRFEIEIQDVPWTIAVPEHDPVVVRQGTVVAAWSETQGLEVTALADAVVIVAEREIEIPRQETARWYAPDAPVSAREHAPTARPRWQKLLRSGDFKHALATLRPAEFRSALRKADAEQLMGLAEAARHARQVEPARQAFAALDHRFPRSRQARAAGFLRGRLELEVARDPQAATALFEQYLKQHPDGRYADHARGRLLTALPRIGRAADAKAHAKDYLAKAPQGPYAAQARRLLTR